MKRRSVLFNIAVAGHCIFALLSSFRSALVVGLDEYFHAVEGATTFAESFIVLTFPAGVHAFVKDVGLVSVLQGS